MEVLSSANERNIKLCHYHQTVSSLCIFLSPDIKQLRESKEETSTLGYVQVLSSNNNPLYFRVPTLSSFKVALLYHHF